jgi:hypothetical protein
VEEYEDAVVPHPHHGKFLSTGHTFYRTDQKFTLSRRELSSQADSSSKKEDDEVDDDDDNDGVEIEDRLAEPDLSDGDDGDDGGKLQDELDLSDTESDPAEEEKKSRSVKSRSELFKAIVSVSGLSVDSALNKWVEKGKDLSRQEITLALINLRKCKMYGRALQVNKSNLYSVVQFMQFNI